MNELRVMEVIETCLAMRGDGKLAPFRRVIQYWDRDGNCLAEVDHWKRKAVMFYLTQRERTGEQHDSEPYQFGDMNWHCEQCFIRELLRET
jgi:hypothetical protein